MGGLREISAEIRRQYGLSLKLEDSNDTKIGIMLGFVFLVLVQVALSVAGWPLRWSIWWWLDIGSVSLVILAASLGFKSYIRRKYFRGVDLHALLARYRENRGKYFSEAIDSAILFAYRQNLLVASSRRKYLRAMVLSLYLGIVLLTLARVCA